MKTILIFASLIFTATLQAQELNVIDVRRNITMSDDDIVYKDYYINGGESSALRKNLVINVKRRVNIKDVGGKNVGDFDTVVGQLKVIHVGAKVSVAREFNLTSRDEEPMLEQVGIMSGDKVDLTGSFINYNKPNYKRKSADTSSDKKDSSTPAPTTETTTAQAATVNTTTPQVTNEADTKTENRDPASSETTLLNKIIPIPTL